MTLSELSVRRPVFATVVSLMLLIVGLMAAMRLSVREYPDIDPPIINIETRYRGASPEVVETRITQVLEDRVAGLPGVDKLTSSSEEERSQITIEFDLDTDVDAAASDVRDRVSRALGNLPEEADPPEVAKVDSGAQAVMWINLSSDRRSVLELTDYAERYLVDQLAIVQGVGRIHLSGSRRYAMRIWLDREALAARALTVADVEQALRAENVELPAGRLESQTREFTLRTQTGLTTEEAFRRLVVGRNGEGHLVQLGEVADVRLGAEDERTTARANAIPAISLGIEQQSKANTVEVSRAVRRELDRLRATLPEDLSLEVNYDRAAFVNESMKEVLKALAFAIGLVLVVIYAFLGNLRATLIPGVTVPISIVATFTVMAFAGYSINVLTLLGLVLAIGLVVDDAIVVLENIHRRIESYGEQPLIAAIDGGREIGFAVIATTLVLVAVFVPISFIQGNIGRLFGEFGISLASAVLFSALVALTLTPMMCSQMLRVDVRRSGFSAFVDGAFRRFSQGYRRALQQSLVRPGMTLLVAAAVMVLAAALLRALPSEYAPREDRGVFIAMMQAPEGASFDYTDAHTRQVEQVLLKEREHGGVMRILTRIPGDYGGSEVNSSRLIALLEPWDQRSASAEEIADRVRQELDQIPGVRVQVITPQGLGVRGSNRPLQVVVTGPSYEQASEWSTELVARLNQVPGIVDADDDYEERKPQLRVSIDRNRAADLGVSLANVGRTLETMLGSRIATTFLMNGEEYNVVLQGREQQRVTPSDLSNIYVRSEITGELVPLASLVRVEEHASSGHLYRFDRKRAVNVTAGLAEGYSLGAAIEQVQRIAAEALPGAAHLEFDGESREFLRAGRSLYVTFLLALVIVFLVLAAQFESFRHPLVIMFTVPLAVTGALIGLWCFGYTINVYSQIGVILLIGLAAKNGVLIVEFSNQLRDRGHELLDAVVEAATTRLRPVLMTSLCTVFGALPLLLATGAGAESRRPIGIVVAFGVSFATLLTLFVVPAAYALIARGTRSPQYLSRLIERLRQSVPTTVGQTPR
jgi:hydrophobe/amphiphile efflux-1 (HAE1) family protein